MAQGEDPMPLARLPEQVRSALLPVNADAGAAAWLPLVRAAVRRTQKRLFVLFSGQAASGPPCEALLRLAATALEACETEGKPQLDLVPLFATAGWADLAAGRAPGRQQAGALRGVQVVFCAGGPADEGGRQQLQQGSDSSRDPGCGGPAEQTRHSLRGRRSTPAGAKEHRRSSTSAAGSDGATTTAAEHSATGAEHALATPDSSSVTDGASLAAAAGHAADAAPAGGVDMAGAVQLAETLSEGRSQGEPPVAVGTLIAAQGGANVAELQPASREPWAWGHVAVGGTFDRLHAGHRILLAATALAATQAVYIGVTGPELLQKKKHAELLESYGRREAAAADYVRAVRPGLEVHTGELHDAKGLAAEVEAIQALVVSEETAAGLGPINKDREERGFAPLEVVTVSLVGASGGTAAKLSSTELREAEAERRAGRATEDTARDW